MFEKKYTLADIDQAKHECHVTFYKTDIDFLDVHNGPRPGCMHTIMGRASDGKSTVMKTILVALLKNHRVLVWLSEETELIFLSGLSKYKLSKQMYNNLNIYSEIDNPPNYWQESLSKAVELFNYTQSELIIFDNISTSKIYRENINAQGNALASIKSMITKLNIPIFIVVHTKSGVNTNALLEVEDVRGLKTISNISEYFYSVQLLRIEEMKIQTVRILKSRSHGNALSKMFRLHFNHNTELYSRFEEISFNAFKVLYKSRDKI